ncbi:MAG TPA: toluene tolerance protein [Gammaproteobacteria bacterium]|uniref:MlaC/ttg2D family ABC transporter substrate-binding protein n=1 Tax=Immundisolibacter sp. TaxID=1934948 RepID=UPI000E833F3D|nr:toluene tolerance protein [Gammaproteobacteria bacterium]HCZ48465.1 toluene tolerance protein [Gammaproteobacteria bacterium]MCH77903.1 toluene tolerance protein [Gammaproteobacteria bacterium]
MIKRFMAAVLGLLLVGALAPASAQTGPVDVVRGTAERVLEQLRTDPARYQDDKVLFGLVREVVFPHLDRERTAQWVLGANWRKATPAQRAQFVEEFSELLLRTYGTALRQYDSEVLNFLPVHAPEGANRVTVRTEIIRPNGPKVSVDYLLTNRSGEWKVYDVIIENVSLVVTYRSEYAAIIQRDGIDGLLKQLADRNRSLKS